MTPHPPIHLKTPLNTVNQPLTILSVPPTIWPSLHVLQDLPSNTSDHCPLAAEVRSNVICCPQKQKKNKHPLYNWRKLSQKKISESYSKTLCNKLRELNPPSSTTNPSAIEEYLSVPPCRNPVKNLFPLRCSNITKSQAGTPQLMLPIDAPKPLETMEAI